LNELEKKMVKIRQPADFIAYAGKDPRRWDLLSGATMEHSRHGIGVVGRVEKSAGWFPRFTLVVKFNAGEKRIPASDLWHARGLSFSTAVLMELRKSAIDISQLRAPDYGAAGRLMRVSKVDPQIEVLSDEGDIQEDIWAPTEEITGSNSEDSSKSITGQEDALNQDAQVELYEKEVDEDFKDDEEIGHPLPKFMRGEKVHLRQNPARVGLITSEPVFGEGEFNYEVFFSGDKQRTITERDLQAIPREVRSGYDRDFLRDLLVLKLQKPLQDNLYSAYASKTKFEVYQFKPAMKFLRNTDQRMLIADEVGLGKTIEAGIIYLELQARLDLPRVLVVCPSGLRYKWQDEFRSRFDEEFEVLDRERFSTFVRNYQRYGEDTRLRGIISIELLRLTEQISAIGDNNILFDLLVIDEAHHCRNAATLTNQMAMTLEEQSDAILLLTATPLQTSERDLFNLLRILNPAEFDIYDTFEDRLYPNQIINVAARKLEHGKNREALTELRKVEQTNQRKRFQSNPYYRDLVELLGRDHLTKKDLVYAQRTIFDLNTFSLLFTRTRKRDVMLDPPIRTAEVIKFPFTFEEEEYYNNVVAFVKKRYMLSHPGSPIYTWTTMMKERQVASCISAFHARFSRELQMERDEIENERVDLPLFLQMDSDFFESSEYRMSLSELRDYICNWKPPADTKFNQFLTALKLVLSETPHAKVLVFSFFKDTVDYLQDRLENEGISSLKMHGGFNIQERQITMEAFHDNADIRVLVSSDVGAEGLDFQFCDTIFNYDLPWNPMKVEQRIGRIDRFGQKSRRIRIYNMVIANSIEERILYRLYDRIGLFEHAIGDIELILGEEINSLAKLVFSKDLTPAEQAKLAERTANNIIRKEQEIEEFESQRLQFMGQDVIFTNMLEQSMDAGGYISENELCALVGTYIQQIDPLSRLDCNPEKDGTYTLMPNDELVAKIRSFITKKRKGDMSAQSFLKRLRTGREMPLTFSSERAYERKPLEFITARHPLTQCAFAYWKGASAQSEMIYKVRLDTTEPVLKGEYHFFIYLLDMAGIKSSVTLHPVVINAQTGAIHRRLSREFIRRVQRDISLDTHVHTQTDLEVMNDSQKKAYQYILRVRNEQEESFRKENEMFLSAQKFALQQSFDAKQKRIDEIKDKVTDERIIRMQEGRLRNLRAKHEMQIAQLENGSEVSVSFTLAMRGFLVVE